jgi:hypothetical protein
MADIVTEIFLHGAVDRAPAGRTAASAMMPDTTPPRRLRRHPAS